MNDGEIIGYIRSTINGKGMKFKFVAEKTKIDAQRLSRIFNQDAKLTVEEFLRLCDFLELSPDMFKLQSSA